MKTLGLPDEIKRWIDELVKNYGRELLRNFIVQWGISVTVGQLISLMREVENKDVKILASEMEESLSRYEDRIKK